jgi:5-methylthioadenosine/S-adenosylhomocysteine deaminase
VKYGADALPPMRVLELATLGGARAMGVEPRVGSIEVGKRADVIVVELDQLHVQPVLDHEMLLSALVYATQASDVRTVFVDGAMVVENQRLVTADERAIVAKAKAQAAKVRARAALA